jgi:predicted nucleic acid-binding protein
MQVPYLDTSALAKWYLNEEASDQVESYLRTLPRALVSSLGALELRCLLARRRRSGEISVDLELEVRATFEDDVSQGHLELLPLADSDLAEAMRIMDRLRDHPLRTLDVLHLAVARSTTTVLATADRVMAAAAQAAGFEVHSFVPGA